MLILLSTVPNYMLLYAAPTWAYYEEDWNKEVIQDVQAGRFKGSTRLLYCFM